VRICTGASVRRIKQRPNGLCGKQALHHSLHGAGLFPFAQSLSRTARVPTNRPMKRCGAADGYDYQAQVGQVPDCAIWAKSIFNRPELSGSSSLESIKSVEVSIGRTQKSRIASFLY